MKKLLKKRLVELQNYLEAHEQIFIRIFGTRETKQALQAQVIKKGDNERKEWKKNKGKRNWFLNKEKSKGEDKYESFNAFKVMIEKHIITGFVRL